MTIYLTSVGASYEDVKNEMEYNGGDHQLQFDFRMPITEIDGSNMENSLESFIFPSRDAYFSGYCSWNILDAMGSEIHFEVTGNIDGEYIRRFETEKEEKESDNFGFGGGYNSSRSSSFFDDDGEEEDD